MLITLINYCAYKWICRFMTQNRSKCGCWHVFDSTYFAQFDFSALKFDAKRKPGVVASFAYIGSVGTGVVGILFLCTPYLMSLLK